MSIFRAVNLLLVFLLQASRTFSSDSSYNETSRQLNAIEEAFGVLQGVGFVVEGMCHPTSNLYAPDYPLCAKKKANGNNGDQFVLRRRKLQQDELKNTDNTNDESWAYLLYYLLISTACVLLSSVMAGLLMGLMTLEPLNLHILIRTSEDERERHLAEELLPLVEQHHLILVSILLVNCYASEALPVFLSKIIPENLAVFLSVIIILLFGEIIPSAVFTGPNQIEIAGRLIPLVKSVIFCTFPVSYPISKLLDALVVDNEERNLYNRGELSALIRIQYEERMAWKRRQIKRRSSINHAIASIGCLASPRIRQEIKPFTSEMEHFPTLDNATEVEGLLEDDDLTDNDTFSLHTLEVNMAEGALQMRTKTVRDIYTPMRDVFSIPYDAVLNEANLATIYHQGFSRIPVYERQNSGSIKKDTATLRASGFHQSQHSNQAKADTTAIRGILFTKHLILVNRSDDRIVSTLPLLKPLCVSPETNLIDTINLFQSGTMSGKGCHMAIVCKNPELAEHALEKEKPIPRKAGVIGIITLEDVMEELLQQNIWDEMDRKERVDMDRARWAIARWKLFVQKRRTEREAAKNRGVEEISPLNNYISTINYGTDGGIVSVSDANKSLAKY